VDQAIEITNANEGEIRTRAAAAGRDPMDVIHDYAARNGYRRQVSQGGVGGRGGTDHAGAVEPMAALATMSDEAFAEATKGDAWRRLMAGDA
jgi:hypothetical protein